MSVKFRWNLTGQVNHPTACLVWQDEGCLAQQRRPGDELEELSALTQNIQRRRAKSSWGIPGKFHVRSWWSYFLREISPNCELYTSILQAMNRWIQWDSWVSTMGHVFPGWGAFLGLRKPRLSVWSCLKIGVPCPINVPVTKKHHFPYKKKNIIKFFHVAFYCTFNQAQVSTATTMDFSISASSLPTQTSRCRPDRSGGFSKHSHKITGLRALSS